jgi:hypothetical protein
VAWPPHAAWRWLATVSASGYILAARRVARDVWRYV